MSDAAKLAEIDAAHDAGDKEAYLKLATEALEGLPEDIDPIEKTEYMWRAARGYYDSGMTLPEGDGRKDILQKGLDLAKKGVEMNPKGGMTNKWHGIVLSKYSQCLGSKEKIANAFVIRDAFVAGIEAAPEDVLLHNCLGQWCEAVANIGWLERKAASILFATPPESTIEEAEKHFLKGYEINPKHCYNLQELARLSDVMGKKEDAGRYWKELSEIETDNASWKGYVENAKKQVAKR